MYRITLLFFFILLFNETPLIFAQSNQDVRLAHQYYRNGEYEKAVVLYEQLYKDNPNSSGYYRNYYKSLLAMKDFETAEKVVKKQMKKRKKDPNLYVDLGLLYKNQDQTEQAEKEFDKALGMAEKMQISSLGVTFSNFDEQQYAVKAYLKGRELMGDPKMFGYELARAYSKIGDIPNMISGYLDYLVVQPKQVQRIKTALYKVIGVEENMDELQTQLYGRIQDDVDEVIYPELLIWAFNQQKDFEGALVQVKALDRRLNEDGSRVMELARQATMQEEYAVAIDAYEYVIAKGIDNNWHDPAKIELLRCRNAKITKKGDYTMEEIEILKNEYIDFLEFSGKKRINVSSMRELAHLYTFYLDDLDSGILMLHEVVDMPSAHKQDIAEAKLDLGDYYLMKNDIWEATLLYSQVDKAFKDDILGEEARFRNAKLSYYHGDFEWSQAQLNVLKASTSELISNDALELSVFITDNMGLDTTAVPMEMFARADLLLMQNKVSKALQTLDSINTIYTGHMLADDILLTKAKIKLKAKDYEGATKLFNQILDDFGTDLLVDDAIFALAELHENHFDDKAKAMEYYQEILINHPSSLYIVEARKRFRRLRGDMLN